MLFRPVYNKNTCQTGKINIELNANDEPDSMDNPCPDSDRDDPLEPFEETSTVSLPTGCSYAGPHDSSVNWDDDEDYYWDGPTWGMFLQSVATYDVDFKYNNCSWECEISNVVSETFVWVRRPDYPGFVSITEASDVPCSPPSEPLLAKSDLTDPDLTDDVRAPNTKYWVHHAMIAHEERHRSDWKDFYGARLGDAISYCESLNTVINCPNAYTHTCQGAKDYWAVNIDETFDLAWDYACDDYDDPSTELDESSQRALLSESYINHPIADELPGGCGS